MLFIRIQSHGVRDLSKESKGDLRILLHFVIHSRSNFVKNGFVKEIDSSVDNVGNVRFWFLDIVTSLRDTFGQL